MPCHPTKIPALSLYSPQFQFSLFDFHLNTPLPLIHSTTNSPHIPTDGSRKSNPTPCGASAKICNSADTPAFRNAI